MQTVLNEQEFSSFIRSVDRGEQSVDLRDKIVPQYIKIEATDTEMLTFVDVVFEHAVVFIGSEGKGLHVGFHRCTFKLWVAFTHCKLSALEFDDCIMSSCTIKDVSLSDRISIRNSSIKEFNAQELSCNRAFVSRNKDSILSFENFTSNSLDISKNGSNVEILITNQVRTLLQSTTTFSNKIDKVNIHVDVTFSGTILVEGAFLPSIKLSGRLNKSTLDLANNTYQNIEVDKLINAGTIRFSSVALTDKASLQINESDLGRVAMFGVNFGEFENITIRDSNVSEVVYSGVKWCHTIKNADGTMTPAQFKETYKQLKNAAYKQNDKPEELRFYGLEMNSYKQQLKTVKKRKGDRLILWFNSITNRHGQSWARPFGIIIATIFVTYFPIKYFLGFTVFHPTLKSIPIAASEMMECFNPVRKFSDSFGISNTQLPNTWKVALAKVLDIFFLRLMVGLLIFQMVKAFRKYVR